MRALLFLISLASYAAGVYVCWIICSVRFGSLLASVLKPKKGGKELWRLRSTKRGYGLWYGYDLTSRRDTGTTFGLGRKHALETMTYEQDTKAGNKRETLA